MELKWGSNPVSSHRARQEKAVREKRYQSGCLLLFFSPSIWSYMRVIGKNFSGCFFCCLRTRFPRIHLILCNFWDWEPMSRGNSSAVLQSVNPVWQYALKEFAWVWWILALLKTRSRVKQLITFTVFFHLWLWLILSTRLWLCIFWKLRTQMFVRDAQG